MGSTIDGHYSLHFFVVRLFNRFCLLTMKKDTVELTKIEKCLIVLAKHIERCPYNEYLVEEQIIEELGYEKKDKKKSGKLTS